MNFPDYSLEQRALDAGARAVIGVDEAGRGPGAGPVVAAAVYIPEDSLHHLLGKVNDSKKLSAKKREYLYNYIIEYCDVGVQDISSKIIDDINILEATKVAMRMAVEQLERYDYVLVDGTVDLSNQLWCTCQQVIKGDALSVSIAAASIVAKVYRDNIMDKLHELYPIYGWDTNRGYLTKKHIEAIKTYGITDFHRQSFRKVGK